MIVYLDSSAFVKLYLEETDSSRVRDAIDGSSVVCTHLIAYAETRAALAQAGRMSRLSAMELSNARQRFEDDWLSVEIIAVDEALIYRAGDLAERLGLRGFDSVHLAACERLAAVSRGGFLFVVFDAALGDAATTLGLPTLD